MKNYTVEYQRGTQEDKGILKLKKEKEETDVSEFKNLLRNMVNNTKIEYMKLDSNNIDLLEMKIQEKNSNNYELVGDYNYRFCNR